MKRLNDPFAEAPKCPGRVLTRRDFLKCAGVVAGSVAIAGSTALAANSPIASIPRALSGIGLCKRYDFAEVRRVLASLFEQMGDVRQLVRQKHITIKTNLVNTSQESVAGIPLWLTVTVHPVVAMALGSLLADYGAKKIVYCDQLPFRSSDEEAFSGYGFNLAEFNRVMNGRARFENTRNLGLYKNYALVKVPGGGEIASAWEVNRAYVDTDVLISLTKLKSHVSGGITGGMKNLFGIPPSSLYGDDLEKEPNETATGYRSSTMHACTRKPLTSIGSFNDKTVEGDHGHNVPRFIVDLTTAFPVQLVVIDGISVIQTAEGWWNGSMVTPTRPGLLIAGRNPVCTDAVAAAVMGFNPDAPDRTWPFVNGTNYLKLARQKGLGENRVSELEVVGLDLDSARFEYQPTFRRVAS